MSAEIIPFDFEEQAVRVVMRGDDPWFVANDVCRVLEIGNPRDAVSRLDDDEKGVGSADTLGGAQRVTVINESGLYALVLTSRKEAARRFRKWITAEVLPAIRRHGHYDVVPQPQPELGQVAGLPIREAELWLQMVREARLTRGTRDAATIWDRSPLPPLAALPATRSGADVEDGEACLAHLLALLGDEIAEARLAGDDSDSLTGHGLRAYPETLFVANFPLVLFEGTAWARGLHRSALLALPGVHPAPTPRTLGGVVTRGLLLPWRLIGAEGVA